MNPDTVDVFETCLISRLGILLCVLLSNVNHFDIACELELDQVFCVNF